MFMLHLLNLLLTTMSLLFINLNHPLTLGMILIVQTLLISMFIGMISQSFWFSYILFLVFIGGMLILFMYTISLIFNKKFIFYSNKLMILISIFMMIIFSYYLLINNNNDYWMINNNETTKMMNLKALTLENSLNVNKLFNFPNFMINLLMISYLLFMLNVVMKITNFQFGPLRNKI